MINEQPETLLDLLYRALNSPAGVIVETDNVPILRARLYALRRQDPALERLSLNASRTDPETQLMIIKK